MRNIFCLLTCALCVSPQALAGNKALDWSGLEAGTHDSIIATTDAGEFKFEDSVLTGIPGAIPHLIASSKNRQKGAEIASQYGLADPAISISTELAKVLSERLAVSMAYSDEGRDESPKMYFSLRSPKNLQKVFGAGKLVVDVRSMNWDVSLDGKDRYRAGYWANAQIVDTSTGVVLASQICVPKIKKKSEAPYVAAMFANDAAELKLEIWEAVEKCREMFMTQMLGVQGASE